MDIIVEDGSMVVDANTYVGVEEAREYASSRNYDAQFLDDEKSKGYLLRAMDYLNSIDDYKGWIIDTDQALPWPRQKVVVNRISVPEDAIPRALKQAQIELAIAIANGVELFPNLGKELPAVSGAVKREKVGPIENEYFSSVQKQFEPLSLPYINKLLDQLRVLRPILRTIRV